ncbi:unnamed protein product [Cochlearia groenlandica]
MAPRESRRDVTQPRDQFGPYQSTLSTEKSKQTPSGTPSRWRGSTVLVLASGNAPSGSQPLLKRSRSRPPNLIERRGREKPDSRLWQTSRRRKSRSSRRAGRSRKSVWWLARPSRGYRTSRTRCSPCQSPMMTWRRKRKRGADNAGMSPRADVRTRSKSADPTRASGSDMRPPVARSADQIASLRVTSRREGIG